MFEGAHKGPRKLFKTFFLLVNEDLVQTLYCMEFIINLIMTVLTKAAYALLYHMLLFIILKKEILTIGSPKGILLLFHSFCVWILN